MPLEIFDIIFEVSKTRKFFHHK